MLLFPHAVQPEIAVIPYDIGFDNKLYLEFGGKLQFDYHAARVLPGYDPNVKMLVLQQIRDTSEVIPCIYADRKIVVELE